MAPQSIYWKVPATDRYSCEGCCTAQIFFCDIGHIAWLARWYDAHSDIRLMGQLLSSESSLHHKLPWPWSSTSICTVATTKELLSKWTVVGLVSDWAGFIVSALAHGEEEDARFWSCAQNYKLSSCELTANRRVRIIFLEGSDCFFYPVSPDSKTVRSKDLTFLLLSTTLIESGQKANKCTHCLSCLWRDSVILEPYK